MASNFDNLLPAIVAAKDAGLSLTVISNKIGGKKKDNAKLGEKLASLVREGAIWGPFAHGKSQLYFATGHGPSIETASEVVERIVSRSGVKLQSKSQLEKKVTGKHARFFADALKHAVANRAIAELSFGNSKYYLHRDVAAEYFGFQASPENAEQNASTSVQMQLELRDLLPIYRRLKAEQGGFSAVKIFDLMQALGRPKEELHRLLLEEAKAERITIHHTTSVELPREVIEAGIRLPGYAEPFVTVVVKDDR
jgi:hypothetical protein